MEEEAIAHGRHASVKNLSASEVCFYMSIPGLGGQILLCRRLSNQGSGPRASPDGLSRRGSGIRRGMGMAGSSKGKGPWTPLGDKANK